MVNPVNDVLQPVKLRVGGRHPVEWILVRRTTRSPTSLREEVSSCMHVSVALPTRAEDQPESLGT